MCYWVWSNIAYKTKVKVCTVFSCSALIKLLENHWVKGKGAMSVVNLHGLFGMLKNKMLESH